MKSKWKYRQWAFTIFLGQTLSYKILKQELFLSRKISQMRKRNLLKLTKLREKRALSRTIYILKHLKKVKATLWTSRTSMDQLFRPELLSVYKWTLIWEVLKNMIIGIVKAIITAVLMGDNVNAWKDLRISD